MCRTVVIVDMSDIILVFIRQNLLVFLLECGNARKLSDCQRNTVPQCWPGILDGAMCLLIIRAEHLVIGRLQY